MATEDFIWILIQTDYNFFFFFFRNLRKLYIDWILYDNKEF